jgi:hypothetical protein
MQVPDFFGILNYATKQALDCEIFLPKQKKKADTTRTPWKVCSRSGFWVAFSSRTDTVAGEGVKIADGWAGCLYVP